MIGTAKLIIARVAKVKKNFDVLLTVHLSIFISVFN